LLPEPVRSVDVDALLARAPLAAGENIKALPVQSGEHSSVTLVQIRDREQPHRHARYDIMVMLVRGTGTLHLGDRALPMRAGDASFITKGTPHYFVNEGSAPAAALVTFAPAFTGPDQAPVE
jgi:mannose-6-phosphate isomerase-like protein (cupin superfamily)